MSKWLILTLLLSCILPVLAGNPQLLWQPPKIVNAQPHSAAERESAFIPIRYVAAWVGASSDYQKKEQKITFTWHKRELEPHLDHHEYYYLDSGNFTHGRCFCIGSGPMPVMHHGVLYAPLDFARDTLGMLAIEDPIGHQVMLFLPKTGKLLLLAEDQPISALPAVDPAQVKAVHAWDEAAMLALLKKHPLLARATNIAGGTFLHAAVYEGKKGIVEYLLAQGEPVDAKTNVGSTPLHITAGAGHMELVNLLLQHGAPVDAQDTFEATPLDEAVQCRQFAVVKVLIAAGAAVNRQSRSESPLQLALQDKNREITVYLLEHGADVNAPSGDPQETPIYAAIDKHDVEMVKLLIAYGAKVDQVNEQQLHPTPLHMAVYMLQPEIVNLLLEKGVPVDPLDGEGRTPLNQMLFNTPHNYLMGIGKPEEVAANRLQIIKALLAHKADPNTRDENGMPPILYAMKSGSVELADALVAAGADIKATDKDGLTALHYAVRSGNEALVARLLQQGFKADQEGWLTPLNQVSNLRIAELLIQAGARVNTVDEYSYTPLQRACSRHEDVAIALLAAGANPNVQDNDGDTPLHVSFGYYQSGKATLALLENGARVDVCNNAGQTPLHAVLTDPNRGGSTDGSPESGRNVNDSDRNREKNRLQAATIMLAKGVDVNAQDKEGYTPLHRAAESGMPDIVRLLLKSGAKVNAKTVKGETPLVLATHQKNQQTMAILKANGGK